MMTKQAPALLVIGGMARFSTVSSACLALFAVPHTNSSVLFQSFTTTFPESKISDTMEKKQQNWIQPRPPMLSQVGHQFAGHIAWPVNHWIARHDAKESYGIFP